MSKKTKSGMSSTAKWGIAFLVELVILLCMVAGYAVFWTDEKLDKIQVVEIKKEDLAINEGVNEAQKGFKTVALFGIDARNVDSMGEGNRSDSIIIASINNDTKEVKMVSIYRDSYLEIADGSGLITKVNAAYSYGGPELAIKTLNSNLDLEITDFVTVNFLALTKAIDRLGGVTVNVKEGELQMLNASIVEQIGVTGIYSDGVFTTGEMLLNGTQATAWARVRSTDRGDITRTERQRTVISKMIAKAKSSNFATIDALIDDVAANLLTSMSKDEMKSLAKDIFDYELGDTTGFPFAIVPYDHAVKGSVLVPGDLQSNVSELHRFLFGTENYTPTQNVQRISGNISAETGIGAQPIVVETLEVQ